MNGRTQGKMAAMEQMMRRAPADRAQVRGKSAEAPGQRKKALGLKSAKTLTRGYARSAAARAGSTSMKRKASAKSSRSYPRGTQS